MSKKKIFIIALIVFVLLLIAVLAYMAKNTVRQQNNIKTVTIQLTRETAASAENKDTMSNQEKEELGLEYRAKYEVMTRDEAGKVSSYRFIGIESTKPIVPEFMTDEERIKFGVGNVRAQILERNSDGGIRSYRLIKNDSDIIMEY
jgi:cell division protein FtsI/penicillin-binding protein 2